MNVSFKYEAKSYGIIAQYVEKTAQDSAAFSLLFFLTPRWGSPSTQHVIETFILFWFFFQLNSACSWVSEDFEKPVIHLKLEACVLTVIVNHASFELNNWTELTIIGWMVKDMIHLNVA